MCGPGFGGRKAGGPHEGWVGLWLLWGHFCITSVLVTSRLYSVNSSVGSRSIETMLKFGNLFLEFQLSCSGNLSSKDMGIGSDLIAMGFSTIAGLIGMYLSTPRLWHLASPLCAAECNSYFALLCNFIACSMLQGADYNESLLMIHTPVLSCQKKSTGVFPE